MHSSFLLWSWIFLAINIQLIWFEIYVPQKGGTHCVMVIIIGNGHDDPSSNPGQVYLHSI